MNQEVEVFRDHYLEGTTIAITSQAIPARGNKCVMTGTLTNGTAGSTTTLTLEGSYDGLAWEQSATTFGLAGPIDNQNNDLASMDYAFVRIHAAITAGTTPKSLFDASLAFSEQ